MAREEKCEHSQSEGRPGRPSKQAGRKKSKKRVKQRETKVLELSDDHLQECVVEFEGGRGGGGSQRGEHESKCEKSSGAKRKKKKESVSALERPQEGWEGCNRRWEASRSRKGRDLSPPEVESVERVQWEGGCGTGFGVPIFLGPFVGFGECVAASNVGVLRGSQTALLLWGFRGGRVQGVEHAGGWVAVGWGSLAGRFGGPFRRFRGGFCGLSRRRPSGLTNAAFLGGWGRAEEGAREGGDECANVSRSGKRHVLDW
jgi:hypothetical protein